MRIHQCLSAIAVALVAATPAAAAPSLHLSGTLDAARAASVSVEIDARGYHHCHNMPRRIRCHSTGRLPVNWPPNSSTPSKASLRDGRATPASTCAGRILCWQPFR